MDFVANKASKNKIKTPFTNTIKRLAILSINARFCTLNLKILRIIRAKIKTISLIIINQKMSPLKEL